MGAREHVSQPIEEGNPSTDTRAFRRSLGHFATGVTVITAHAQGRSCGLTANSFSSVSLDPPLILWSITRTSESLPIFLDAGHFAVNVLAAEQIEVANRFARSGGDKFSGIAWRPGQDGAPLLPDIAASFECRREAMHESGDHLILIGRVERFVRFDRAALVFAHGRYGLVTDHPSFAQDRGGRSDALAAASSETMLTLLRKAYGQLSRAFQAHRDAEGITVNQGRVLTHLDRNPGASIDAIAGECFLGPLDAEEAAAALVGRGYVVRERDGAFCLTSAGRERLNALRARVMAFEAERLQGLPASDVDAARRVLKAFGSVGLTLTLTPSPPPQAGEGR